VFHLRLWRRRPSEEVYISARDNRGCARARDLIKDRPSKAERRARARARGCPSFRGRKSFRAGANELVEREVILSGTADYRLQLPRLPALLLPDFLGSSADYNMVTGLPAVPRRASPRESGFFARESRAKASRFLSGAIDRDSKDPTRKSHPEVFFRDPNANYCRNSFINYTRARAREMDDRRGMQIRNEFFSLARSLEKVTGARSRN